MNFEFSTLNPRRDGFTLLELLIVLSLITLILGLSPVFYANTMPSAVFNATARELSATVRYARSLARIHGEVKTMAIDIDSRKYGIEGRSYKGIPSDIEIKVIDPLAGEIHRGIYRLVFQPAGGTPGGTIVLESTKRKREVKIVLDPVVGSVVIK